MNRCLCYCLTALLLGGAYLGLEYGVIEVGYTDPTVCRETAP